MLERNDFDILTRVYEYRNMNVINAQQKGLNIMSNTD